MRLLIVGAALVFLCTPGVSFAKPLDRAALNQRQENVTTCAVYYSIVAMCVGNSDPALKDQLRQTSELLRVVSVMLGQHVGMSEDAVASR